MADTKISALTAASVALGADEIPVNEAGTSKKATLTQVQALIQVCNYSVASQTITAATLTYITGSKITVPVGKLRIGTILRWKFNITKTAAGTALSTYAVYVGTNGTTADTARLSFTKPAGTGVIDEGFIEITVIVRGPLSASGIIVGEFVLSHNLAATGHAVIPNVVVNVVSSAFDVTVANLFVGICVTTGASDAITIQQVVAEAVNL